MHRNYVDAVAIIDVHSSTSSPADHHPAGAVLNGAMHGEEMGKKITTVP